MSSTDIYFCFCCLSTDDLFSLFNSNSDNNYAAMLKEICTVDPSPEEYEHNSYICSICISKLQDAVHFKRQVWETLAVLEKNGLIQLSHQDKEAPEQDVSDGDGDLCEQYEEALSETDENLRETKDLQTEFLDDSVLSSETVEILPTIYDDSQTITNITNDIQTHDGTETFNLEINYDQRTDDNKYQCSLCEKKIKTKKFFRIHMMRHSGITRYACTYCDKRFLRSTDLKAHVRTHTGERPYKCKICGKGCTQSTHLNTHMKQVHYREKSECQICHTLITPQYLKRHMLSCGRDKPFDCSICRKRFSCKGDLVIHLRSHETFPCTICDKKFSQKSYLRQHIYTHSGRNPNVCHICKEEFSRGSKLKAHIMIKHDGDLPFKCATCGEKFLRKRFLYFHLKTHVNEKPYKCKFCEKTYAKRLHLRRHVDRIHTEQTSFQCNHCKEIFTEREALKEHMKTHANEKSYECEVCNLRFSFKQTWQRHIDMHSKECYCHICGKSFDDRDELAEHVKIHMKEEPAFECQLCDKTFSEVSYLQVHMETHSKKKLYTSVKFIRKISS